MTYTTEQFIATQQANVQELKGLSTRVFTDLEKLNELNMAATKAMLAGTFGHARELTDAKTPQEWMSLQGRAIKPLTEKSATYGWAIYEVSNNIASHFSQAMEHKMTQTQLIFTDMVNDLLKNAPNGTEPALAIFKSAVNAGHHAIDAAQSSAKKTVKMAESNMTEMTKQAISASAMTKQTH